MSPFFGRDKDITTGWVRKRRRYISRVYEATFKQKSPMFKRYVDKISRMTNVPKEEVLKSQPVRNFLRRLAGT